MTIKCALCGGEWEDVESGNYNPEYTHPKTGCPLAGIETPLLESEIVDRINAAIEAAKVDTRKPGDCRHRKPQEYANDCVCAKPGNHSWCAGKCPCAAFEKKKE